MNLEMFKHWKKTDTILVVILASALIIAITYATIRLTDPYYGPCEYQYISSGRCQDNMAWHLQNSISDWIHKIIPYAIASNNTNTTIQTQYCPIPGTNPVRYNTSCYTFTPQTFDKLIAGFQKALNGTLPDEK